MKKILFFCLFSLFFTGSAYAEETAVLIINQIRGNEVCCQAGSLDLLDEIKEKQLHRELSFGWALRYDVLKDKKFLQSIRDVGEFGLLLEITPNLAKLNGVKYKGIEDGSDWYFAKNVFLIGYTPQERKKLIDTLFSTFKSEFGYYPSFTVSWMIDAWTLNYINKTYNVKLHEITKEQFETDSYTLYGGIFNSPYYPSTNHPLLPGYDEDKLNLIIIRQTVSDLLHNYGSTKAYFTSQPNDYLENPEKKDLNYFKSLLENSIDQNSGKNFIMLGFENSLSWEKYGNEYIKQLELVLTMQKSEKIKVKKPTEMIIDFMATNPKNKPFYLMQNFDPKYEKGVLWYFGLTYRARVLFNKNRLIITDLRNFSKINDPYSILPAKFNYAYQIIPYLFDGSSQYELSITQEKELRNRKNSSGIILPDYLTEPFGLVIGEGPFILDKKSDSVKIILNGTNKGEVEFLADKIIIDSSLDPKINAPNTVSFNYALNLKQPEIIKLNNHFDFFIKNIGKNLQSGFIGQDNNLVVLFEISNLIDKFVILPSELKNLDNLFPVIQPDLSTLPISTQSSIYYWNNKQAIAGRNPVRLFVLPLNFLNRPAKVENIKLTFPDNPFVKVTYPTDFSYRITPWFIDIWAQNTTITNIKLEVNGIEVIKDAKIEFVTDCSKELKKCLTSWKQAIKYVLLKLSEYKMRIIK